MSTFTPWTPSPAAVEAGRSARVEYRNASLRSAIPVQYRGATRTQLPITPGLRMLRAHVVQRFPYVTQTYMGGRSRPMLDTERLDMHQEGRAIDFMVRQLGHAPDHAKGDPIANYLVENAERFGVQFVVWAGFKFNAGARLGSAARLATYGGTVPHLDHPHVELTPDAGEAQLDWYRSQGTPPPETAPSKELDGDSAPYEGLGGPSPLVMGCVGAGAVLVPVAAWWFLSRRK